MEILVVNGSPSGKNSITLYTALYLEKLFPGQSFSYLNAAQTIHGLQKDFTPAIEALSKADLILFAYPVYTFIAPSQLHSFIRMMKESVQKGLLEVKGKTASQITTSKHFYDITAHNYVRDNCFDLGLNFIPGLSADMDDLLKTKGQKQASDWFRHLLWSMENGIFEKPIEHAEKALITEVDVPESIDDPKKDKDIVILVDSSNSNPTLEAMVKRFQARLPYHTRVIDLGSFLFKGGCLGCFHCAPKGECIYKDGFEVLLREHIQKTDCIIEAFNIQDHSMGVRFKMYDDRQFCNGHRTVTMGMPTGYIITGNLDAEENLRVILEGRSQVGGNYIAGIATNQTNPEKEVDNLAKNLEYVLENGFEQSSNFYGVGGTKIFRDLIYLMQGLMKEDHRFYKAHGLYDTFPQKQRGTIFKMKLVGLLMNNPKLIKKAGDKVSEGMVGPYRKVVDNAKEL